jgi:hypothetical protein
MPVGLVGATGPVAVKPCGMTEAEAVARRAALAPITGQFGALFEASSRDLIAYASDYPKSSDGAPSQPLGDVP